MKIEAYFSPIGPLIPGYITCKEFSLLKHLSFLLDTGSAISALSVKDLGFHLDLSGFMKKETAAIGVGGSLECYLIHDVILFLFSVEKGWVEVKKFEVLSLLPPAIDQETGDPIYLPSIIGRDIIGIEFDLIYGRTAIYLER